MEEHTDYIEFERPNGCKVRVVFELYRFEILFHYCEYQHSESIGWKSMKKGDDGYFEYTAPDENGKETNYKIKYPTFQEMMSAQAEIGKRYNIIDV